MTRTRGDIDAATQTDRCMSWMSSTSVVFPVAALGVSLLTFFTTPPTPAIVAVLAIALLPWALVAGGVDIPPMAVVLITLAADAWLVVRLDDQATLFLGVVACTWSAATGLRWASLTSVVGFSIVSIGCDIANNEKSGWVIWATGMVFGWFAGSLLFRQQRLTEQLAAARSDLAIAAAEHERKAIAREVHDIVGHSLTVVLLNIAGARRHLATNPRAAAEAMERAESISRDSLETVRAAVGLLSSTGDSQREAPLPGGGDVVPLLEQAQRSGLPLALVVTGDPADLEPAIGLTVVRLLQESLSNASRHAAGEQIDVALTVETDSVRLVVSNRMERDDGRTGQPATATRAGLGVASMTDRVAAVHGTLDAGVRGDRWEVRCVLPRSMSRNNELTRL